MFQPPSCGEGEGTWGTELAEGQDVGSASSAVDMLCDLLQSFDLSGPQEQMRVLVCLFTGGF